MSLTISNLSFAYPKEPLLFHEVSFSLNPGELLTILGPNGAGKSTLLHTIAGLLTPNSGEVLYENQNLHRLSPRERSLNLCLVPQQQNTLYAYSVRDVLLMGRAPHLGPFSQPKEEDVLRVEDVMTRFGLEGLASKSYASLSGGERQQVNIARAVVQGSPVILLDEPTNHLDFGNQVRTLRRIAKLQEEGFILIMTNHHPDQVLYLGSYVGVLDGKGHFTMGTAKDLVTERLLDELYHVPVRIVELPEFHGKICIPVP